MDPDHTIQHQQEQGLDGSPLPYAQFCARLRGRQEQDLEAQMPPQAEAQPAAISRPRKFNPGQPCITSNAASAIPADEVTAALRRHIAGDWGGLCAHDLAENERALRTGGRLLSEYYAANGLKFWIITDAGWQVTTVLLPEDY